MSNQTKERLWLIFWILFGIAILHACINQAQPVDPQDDGCYEVVTPWGTECQ